MIEVNNKLADMKFIHLHCLMMAIFCIAVSCMGFIVYLNNLTMQSSMEFDANNLVIDKQDISTLVGTDTVHRIVRRWAHRDSSDAYADSTAYMISWSAKKKKHLPNTHNMEHKSKAAKVHLPQERTQLAIIQKSNNQSYQRATLQLGLESPHIKLSGNPGQFHSLTQELSIWPDAKHMWDDRIIPQINYMPDRKTNTRETQIFKVILVYSSLGNTPAGREVFLNDKCPVNTCTLTTDVRWVPEADAIVFPYDPGVNVSSWPRPPQQIWVLSLLESPLNLPSLSGLSNQINWTATYRSDSTIVTPYNKFVPYSQTRFPSIPPKHLLPLLQGKSKQVAWFVSNCIPRNKRMEYVRELSTHIQVDIYGECGKLKCPISSSQQCQNMLNTDYKFYLAFENSNCQYYITEKFFNALRNNIIPVVMGARKVDYLAVAPPHSFIHVEDFSSPKKLAEYLHLLNKNQTLYNEYFRWKETGHFIDTRYWCRLCSLLHSKTLPILYYSDVEKWWRANETCTSDKWNRKEDFVKDWRTFG